MILIDTHALIWFTHGSEELGKRAKQLIVDHVGLNAAGISAISFWEAAMLTDKGRVTLVPDLAGWVENVLSADGISMLAITPQIAVHAGSLPGSIHGDPADRILIATALAHDCPLLTADRRILDYAESVSLKTIDAGR